MSTPEKTAVVLFNLGGPSGEADIEPFLFNFFMDKNIIPLPAFFRCLVAKWISWSRGRGAAREAYRHLGGSSPLLKNTREQAQALEAALRGSLDNVRVFVSMRHWHPLADEVVKQVAAFKPEKIILLPLYPQFSTTTSFSSLQNWQDTTNKYGLSLPTAKIACYPVNQGFISASADLIKKSLLEAPKKVRLLFSAHSLPEKVIRSGDPYQWQCEQTAAAVVRQINDPRLDWRLCYQSKVGALPWIGPSIGEELEKAADDHVAVLVYPLSFVSEHVETLVEIDIEYRRRAQQMGIPYFSRVPTVGTHPLFIQGLKELVLSHLYGANCGGLCPEKFSQCYCRIKND